MHEAPRMLVVEGAVEGDFARWAAAGLAQVQDPTSAGIVAKLDLDECLTALDRCCGLGTKTIQIAEAVGPEGLVVAVDPAKPRIERLKRTIKERGLTQIKPVVAGMMSDVKVDKPFDRVLIDAPCSNSGVLIRRPEARYRQDAKSLQSLCDLQRRILLDTLPHVRPGGMLVYSTCSIWPEENGEQIIWLMQQTDQFEVLSVETILPSLSPDADRHHDGGFVAVLAHKG
jgi:16S rRNA (cytosine967-C5)-methyltransferase